MSNSLFFSLAGLLALLLIAAALVYPQGLGTRSPGPFGHPMAAEKAVPAPAAAGAKR